MAVKRLSQIYRVPHLTDPSISSEFHGFFYVFFSGKHFDIKELQGQIYAYYFRMGETESFNETDMYRFLLSELERDDAGALTYYAVSAETMLDLLISDLTKHISILFPPIIASKKIVTIYSKFIKEYEDYDEYEFDIWLSD